MRKLTKPVLRVLERCFEAEMNGVPAQFAPGRHCEIDGISVGSAVGRAVSEGLIDRMDVRLDGWPPVTVRGFGLTHRGRMAYCEWAAENGE